jgi:DNA-binding MarR family transcriptional regulator
MAAPEHRTQREDQLVLELLDAVDKKNDLSQRRLANDLGVALGLANSYLKRCMRKGFIKISEAPANRYLYYLTPKGFAEKSRLTAKYLTNSLEFYRKAGESCIDCFHYCHEQGWHTIILCGRSDLAEIAAIRAIEMPVEILGTYDPHTEYNRFIGKDVWHEFDEAPGCDAFLLTDVRAPRVAYQHLRGLTESDRIIVPKILGLKITAV